VERAATQDRMQRRQLQQLFGGDVDQVAGAIVAAHRRGV